MLFVSGIHGVGKSFFCQQVKDLLGFDTFSASSLIAEKKQSGFSDDKLIPDIDDNQQFLLTSIVELNLISRQYLLDGHFCLLNAEGKVQRIPKSTFITLKPDAILLLTEIASIIAERRSKRDGINHRLEDIELFQSVEIQYATEIAAQLNIPLHISPGVDGLSEAILFVEATMRGLKNDR